MTMTADSPLFAMDPDMEAVIQMVPLIFLFFICRAVAWTDKNVPIHQHTLPNSSPGDSPVTLTSMILLKSFAG